MLKYEDHKGLNEIDLVTGLSRLDKLMDFCQQPRTSKEICNFVGVGLNGWTRKAYVYELIDSGKLKMLNPSKRTSCTQRYVSVDINIPTATAEEIMEYCLMPRTKSEIAKHFRLSWYQIKVLTNELIENGKLTGSTPEQTKNRWQRFLSVDSEMPIDISECILKYCLVPRSRKEISDLLELNIKYVKRYIYPLVESGKLKMTKPEIPLSIKQRFVTESFNESQYKK